MVQYKVLNRQTVVQEEGRGADLLSHHGEGLWQEEQQKRAHELLVRARLSLVCALILCTFQGAGLGVRRERGVWAAIWRPGEMADICAGRGVQLVLWAGEGVR